MRGVERDSNGWKAHALELWVESRERVADDLCVRADCFARLGFVEDAERDRCVAGRLRHRAAIDRVEAAELWRCHSLRFVHRRLRMKLSGTDAAGSTKTRAPVAEMSATEHP